MKRHEFKQLLLDLNPQTVAEHSSFNHHVHGMDYLCLHRSDKLTVKLYFIDPARLTARAGEALLVPHTHRYAFESTVLAGSLTHLLFEERLPTDGNVIECERWTYQPEGRIRTGGMAKHIRQWNIQTHRSHHSPSYWVDTEMIHTLIVPQEPVLLGLVQFADTAPTSNVYIRKGSEMKFVESQTPTPIGAWNMRNKALEMMERA
jgi:hypothetical protein